MRSVARRIRTLSTEVAELKTTITELVTAVAPQLLDQPGIGPITAAQVYIAWSHPRRCRNEAAFARLAGVAPLKASSGQHTRHRLSRYGDRQLNQALHTIAITRARDCPKTRAYIAKRISQGKTIREARRCLKRYIARHLYRLLENPPPNPENSLQPQATPPKSSNPPGPKSDSQITEASICKSQKHRFGKHRSIRAALERPSIMSNSSPVSPLGDHGHITMAFADRGLIDQQHPTGLFATMILDQSRTSHRAVP